MIFALSALALTIGNGCSDRPPPTLRIKASAAEFRKIRFADDWVVVSFQSGLTTANVPEAMPGYVPKVGDQVVLSGAGEGEGEGEGEVFLAGDLESLQFYHSAPGPEQLGRFRSLAEAGKLFIVARGTTAIVSGVVTGRLPDGLHAIELRPAGEKGVTAWVSETFVRRLGEVKK